MVKTGGLRVSFLKETKLVLRYFSTPSDKTGLFADQIQVPCEPDGLSLTATAVSWVRVSGSKLRGIIDLTACFL